MKGKVIIKTEREIREPSLLRGALESMGFLLEEPENGNGRSREVADHEFDSTIQDNKGHSVRRIDLRKWLESRKTPE